MSFTIKHILHVLTVAVVVLCLAGGCKTNTATVNQKSVDHYIAAVALHSSSFDDKAILELRQAIKLNPDFGLAHSLLGSLYNQNQDYDQAIAAYKRACTLDPWSFKEHFNLGMIYHNIGRYPEAVDSLMRACQIQPNHIIANYTLALCYYETKQYENAVELCRKAITLQPENEDFYTTLGKIFNECAK